MCLKNDNKLFSGSSSGIMTFEDYAIKFNRSYESYEEKAKRKEIFQANQEKYEILRSQGTPAEVNILSDRTEQ